MPIDRPRLQDPVSYYASQDVHIGPGKAWGSGPCHFHGGRDTMRYNKQTGAFVCMAQCGARGGDIVAYQMATHGQSFVEAAKALGAWVEDGRPSRHRPLPFPARDGLVVLGEESMFVAVAALNVAAGVALADAELDRLVLAANRIQFVAEAATS